MKRLFGLFIFIYALGFTQKSEIDSKITFNNDQVLNAKIPFITNLFDENQIDEITLADKNIIILKLKKLSSPILKINPEPLFIFRRNLQKL